MPAACATTTQPVAEAGGDDSLLSALTSTFGHVAFRDGQRAIIETIIAGQDCFVLWPTSGGKSLCYQLPALLMPGMSLVISPLTALMDDQIKALNRKGIAAAALHSGKDETTNHDTETLVKSGDIKLLYVAPERLKSAHFIGLLRQTNISLIAIDEAHCASWGHDFRPDYHLIARRLAEFKAPRIATTATADAATQADIFKYLGLRQPVVFEGSLDRPNLNLMVVDKESVHNQILNVLKKHPQQSGIIFRDSRLGTEDTARYLNDRGYPAIAYHAGLDADTRSVRQNKFMNEDYQIMVATVAFGMGVDKDNIRFIFHADMPHSIANWVQEFGRAGRDGLPASIYLAYSDEDLKKRHKWIDDSDHDASGRQNRAVQHKRLEDLADICTSQQCRRQALLHYFGQAHPGHCMKCDACLDPKPLYDASIDVQKTMSAIWRTGQTHNIYYIINVLRGMEAIEITAAGHHTLKTFGCGREYSVAIWRALIREMIRAHCIDEKDNVLSIPQDSHDILRGQRQVYLIDHATLALAPKKRKDRKEPPSVLKKDVALYDALKQQRRHLAHEENTKAFMIFHDATLAEMAKQRPQTLPQLRNLPGIGDEKLSRYGDRFIAIIKAHTGQT